MEKREKMQEPGGQSWNAEQAESKARIEDLAFEAAPNSGSALIVASSASIFILVGSSSCKRIHFKPVNHVKKSANTATGCLSLLTTQTNHRILSNTHNYLTLP